jgi:hypothetical protein
MSDVSFLLVQLAARYSIPGVLETIPRTNESFLSRFHISNLTSDISHLDFDSHSW